MHHWHTFYVPGILLWLIVIAVIVFAINRAPRDCKRHDCPRSDDRYCPVCGGKRS